MVKNDHNIATLHNLLDYSTCKFIVAEAALKTSLLHWINQADSVKLKLVLQKYTDLIEQHIKKFEEFVDNENGILLDYHNRVMQAFIDEANDTIALCADTLVRDACLLASIQMINHHKISAYGTAAAFAKELEMENVTKMFREAEINEKQIDDRLSQLAEYEINAKAKSPIVIPDHTSSL